MRLLTETLSTYTDTIFIDAIIINVQLLITEL